MSFTHSPILQALGYAIINSLWQFALLWLIYVLINSLVKLSSGQKYVTGYMLQVSGFVWFAVTLFKYYLSYGQAEEYTRLLQKRLFAISNSESALNKTVSFIKEAEQLLPYLSMSYLALLLFLSCRYWRAYGYTKTLRKNGLIEIDDSWKTFVQEFSRKLHITRNVAVYLSEIVNTPLTVGYLKPLILIPVASINNLTTHQLEAVILHELAHIKRYDYIFNLLLTVIETVLFFNPFMHLIARHIQRERENCCDDYVLEYKYNTSSYARALLLIASLQTPTPVFALKATDDKKILLTRVKRMIERKEKTFFNFRHQLMALLVMTVILGLPTFLMQKDQKDKLNVNTFPYKALARKTTFNLPFLSENAYFLPKEKYLPLAKEIFDETLKKSNQAQHFDTITSPKVSTMVEPLEKEFSTDNNELENETSMLNDEMQKQSDNPTNLRDEVAIFPIENDIDISSELNNNNRGTDQIKKVFTNQQKIMNGLKTVLKEIKIANQNQQPVQLQNVVTGNEKVSIIKLQRQLFALTDNAQQKAELQLLISQIQKEIAQINNQNLLLYTENLESRLHFQLPIANFTPENQEKLHSFSFEFSTAPKIALPPSPPRFKTLLRKNEENQISPEENDEQFEKRQPVAPSTNLIKIKEPRIKHLHVIRI